MQWLLVSGSSAVKLRRYEPQPDRARETARFLARVAWDNAADNFPFEHGHGAESLLYFFDCGIIVRGLLATWRKTREQFLLDRAVDCARAMIRDFDTGREIEL